MKYVIIGSSTAAVGAVEGIRQLDSSSEIVLISMENLEPYSRPLISYMLSGKIDREKIYYRSRTFYEDQGVSPILGRRAVQILPETQEVLLDDGTRVSYDRLLLATGSVPVVPPIQGMDQVASRTTFLSHEDAVQLETALFPEARVLILGAGLIGLKCAEGIVKKTASVTVVDLAPRILSSILDDAAAGLVQQHLEKNGIHFLLNAGAERFEKNCAFLSDGSSIEFDVLVVAVGVRPAVDLLKDAGGKVERGIVTDSMQCTFIPNVYAAGDCTESVDLTTGQRKVMALLPNAYAQGETAGMNMAGGRQTYSRAIPMNAIGFFGLHMITAGTYDGEAYETVDIEKQEIRRFFVRDGLLKGYMLIGRVEKAGIYTSLIRDEMPLVDLDFELIREKPGLMAFSKKDRIQKLNELQAH